LFRTCPSKRRVIGAIILVILLASVWYWFSNRSLHREADGAGVKDIDPESFSALAVRGKPGILEFYTTSCPYCKKIEPELAEVNAQYGAQIFVVKMNAEKYPDEAGKYQIPGVPTLIFFDAKGEPKVLAAGYRDVEGIVSILKNLNFVR